MTRIGCLKVNIQVRRYKLENTHRHSKETDKARWTGTERD
jgi:hypothetical protein